MRNWWAHVAVGIDDCAAALQAVADFLGRVLKHLKLSDTSGLDQLNSIIDSISISKFDSMKVTEDQVAYLYLVRAFRRLSKISDGVMKTCAHSDFGKALLARMKKKEEFFTRRQKNIMESVDVARAVLDIQGLGKRVKGDCMIVVRARNCFAHEAEQSSRVLAAACAIGAVSRLLQFISEHCKLDGEASPMRSEMSAAVSEISEYQAKLLARMGALDLPYLLQQLALSHETEFEACQYSPLLSSDYAKAMFLLKRHMPRHLATRPAAADHVFTLSKDDTTAKRQRSLLRIAMLVPPSVQESQAAVDWLLSLPSPSLLGCSGLRALCHGFKKKQEDVIKVLTFEGSWMECVPAQSQKFLLELIDAMNGLIKSQQDVLDAEGMFEMACERSQEAREKVRTSDHSSRLSGESKFKRWTRLSEVLSDHKATLGCALKCCDAVTKVESKEADLKDLLTESASMQQAKKHLATAFHDISRHISR